MHILMTVNATWNIWNFRRPIVEALIAEGHRITVLAPTDDSVPDLERLGCQVLPLEMSVKGLNPFKDLRLYRRFKQIFKEQKPDVILSYTIKNNIFGAMASQTVGIPFIPNVTGLGTAFLSGGFLQSIAEQLYRRAFGKLPIIFFQNDDDRNLFIDRRLVRADQARLLPGSGIDLTRFTSTAMPPADKPRTFLMIARLLRDKGVHEYVEAAKMIKANHPQVLFKMLGATGSENRTATNAETVNGWVKDGIIEYLGETNDVRPAIADASCVVLPSYREGAPRTLIEAAAMARPLIATDVPGCTAVVDRDVSGYLCEVRSAKSLAAAIERFLALSTDAQQAMGQAGRAKMEREFDQAIVVEAYRKAIENVVKSYGE